jgi:diguanylate cyclase (GGDEF)-like protein
MQKMELVKQIARNPNIPSPPTVVLRVLEQASRSECTIGDLCKIIEMDPGLASNILRIVNSAMFGLSRPAGSVQRALAVVGVNAARLLVLAIALPKIQRSLKADPIVRQRYWKSSIAGAIVARELAQRLNARDPEDDMAAGLLSDLGEMILQQLFPDAYQQVLQAPAESIIREQCHVEETHCGLDHAEVGAFLLERWRLPADMTEPVRFHEDPDQGAFSTVAAEERARRLHFASRAAQLLLFPDQPIVLAKVLELAHTQFEMDAAAVSEFLGPLCRKITEFAAVLQVDIGAHNDFSEVLANAGEQLVSLTMTASMENQRALMMTRQAESEARHWKKEAVFDPLTKAHNRRFLEARLRELFEESADTNQSFGILFIDLDGFKELNDRNGHLFGDQVLQQITACLNRHVRPGDIVARYGGDEFCMLFVPVKEKGLQTLAERIWTRINELTFRHGIQEWRIGASIGAIFCQTASVWANPDALLAAADQAMYQAKSRGKNRVVFMGSPSGLLKSQPTESSAITAHDSSVTS